MENTLNVITNNWQLILGVLVIIGIIIYTAIKTPTRIKEWLIYAVTLAEKELGRQTGQLKLRLVYDLFVGKFPIISKIISFELFSKWVDNALIELKKMIENNKAVQNYINS